MSKSKLSIHQITTGALLIAVLIISSQIAFDLPSGVPVTLQTFAIALIGFLLGPLYGSIVVGSYLFLGLLGLPVFTHFRSGPWMLVGPTGGYLIGFLPMTALIGLASEKFFYMKGIIKYIGIGLLAISGLLSCHLLGIIWLAFNLNLDLISATLIGSIPFILKDIISVVLAYITATTLRKTIKLKMEQRK